MENEGAERHIPDAFELEANQKSNSKFKSRSLTYAEAFESMQRV